MQQIIELELQKNWFGWGDDESLVEAGVEYSSLLEIFYLLFGNILTQTQYMDVIHAFNAADWDAYIL